MHRSGKTVHKRRPVLEVERLESRRMMAPEATNLDDEDVWMDVEGLDWRVELCVGRDGG